MTDYGISELSALTGLSVRTIRYYLAESLIPPASKEGPAARYPEVTLARLRLIARLRDAHQPLAEIRRQLETLSDAEIVAVSATPAIPQPAESALDYVRALLGSGQTPALRGPSGPAGPSRPTTAAEVPPRLVPDGSASGGPLSPKSAVGQRSQWERIAITPDIELHVRRPLSRRDNRMVERLIAFARQLQGEDTP